MFKVNNGSSRSISPICLKLKIQPLEQRHGSRSGINIVHFEQITPIVLRFSLSTLNK